MPYPAQVDRAAIIAAARALIEQDGVEALSLARLAGVLGIRASSLYNHVASKGALLRLVSEALIAELVAATQDAAATAPDDPRARLVALAHGYRAFAHAHPALYTLTFTLLESNARPDADALAALALPLQAAMAGWTAPDDALTALRGFWALLHGFVLLELGAQFQRGGSLDAAFSISVERFLDGWNTR